MSFHFNEHGVCKNPKWITYHENRNNPLLAYCRVGLFQHPDTGEWMGAASFKNGYTGQHGCSSKYSLQRFATQQQAELHYLDYILGDQFKGLGTGNWGDHNYLATASRRAVEARLLQLRPVSVDQLALF
ncbi:MAG: hypothetical protein ACRYFX_29255 [Janthinobacterium lividum]